MFDGPGSYNGRKNGYQETLQSRNTMMDVELIELCWSNILCPGVPVSRVTTFMSLYTIGLVNREGDLGPVLKLLKRSLISRTPLADTFIE
ncbi:hypothetical protein Tco_0899272 [Tanacetum coccineum]